VSAGALACDKTVQLLITCEHGGNRIPARYRPLFEPYRNTLESHRGYDAGALALARDLAGAYGAELVYSTISRLLVELNRSPNHRQVLSEVTRGLPAAERQRLLQRYYWPYRNGVEAHVHSVIARGERIVHVSSHSFTPRLNGVRRRADVGLLYDPRRAAEREFCAAWKGEIEAANPQLVVRRNYPYRGADDGLTTHLRRLHADPQYAGIEIEINQKHASGNAGAWRALRKLIVTTLGPTLAHAASAMKTTTRQPRSSIANTAADTIAGGRPIS
jgi:predicted N-formylglutamate amidohydrolase